MTEHPHEDVRRLFDMAMAVPASQRETVLDRECPGDDDLKQRILAMVEAAEDPRFLAEPTAHIDRAIPTDHAPAGSRGFDLPRLSVSLRVSVQAGLLERLNTATPLRELAAPIRQLP